MAATISPRRFMMNVESVDEKLQSWLSELRFYGPRHLGGKVKSIEVPMPDRGKPVKASAFIGFLRTSYATIKIECVGEQNLPPSGYMRGMITPWYDEDAFWVEVEWEELGDGPFDCATLFKILATALSYGLLSNDTDPRTTSTTRRRAARGAAGPGSHLGPFRAN
jgi:hypothetical protein